MTTIPSYNGQENLRRIKMQKTITFVIVEGSDDVPIYESCLAHMAKDCSRYDIIYAGGKAAIRNHIENNRTSNAIFIIDRDFEDFNISDSRIVSLDRYSVENYFICSEVISHSLKFALGCKFQDAMQAFDLNQYIETITKSVERLIRALYYYQREVAPSIQGERPAWSDVFLCENSSWMLCNEKIENLIKELLPTDELVKAADIYFHKNFSLPGSIIDSFPGKMLKHSLQRYIRQKVIELKPGAKGKYNDVETTRELLSATMHRSQSMHKVLAPVVTFIYDREIAMRQQ